MKINKPLCRIIHVRHFPISSPGTSTYAPGTSTYALGTSTYALGTSTSRTPWCADSQETRAHNS